MGNESPPHLIANLQFNLQIKMPERKLRSEMGLLNTLHTGGGAQARSHQQGHQREARATEGQGEEAPRGALQGDEENVRMRTNVRLGASDSI